MSRIKRNVARTAALGAACVLASAAPAAAFECYNASRSAQGNESAAGSSALGSFRELLSDPDFVGLCPDGVDHVLSGLHDAGFRTDLLINTRTLMASGLARNHPEKLHDGSGIDHLSEEFFVAVDPLIEAGFGICASG